MKLQTVVTCYLVLVLLAAVPCCLSSAALLEQAGRPTAPQGAVIPNRFIVALKPGYGDAATTAAGLVREVKAALRSTAAARGTSASTRTALAGVGTASAGVGTASANSDFDDIVLVKISQPPSRPVKPASSAAAGGVAMASAAAAAAATPAGSPSVVLRASAAAMQRVRASPRVHAVIQDRYVRSQQLQQPAPAAAAAAAKCVTANAARVGVAAPAPKPALARAFAALGCNVAAAKFVYKGKVCSSSSSSSIEWTQVAAVDRRSNQQLASSSSGKPCRLLPGPNAAVNRQRFGGCGVAPALAPSLPVHVCGPTSRVGTAPGGAAGAAGGATGAARGVAGGAAGGVAVGAAGGAAGGVGGSASGGAAAGGLPRVPVAANEQVPAGVRLIGAASSAGVANMAAGKPLVVAVVDSGVDGSHPDINYVGGKAFVVPSAAVPGDSADPAVDLYGHGTHVAGIIGANNGGTGGVVGVAPGVGIFSLKVMDAQGVGSLSDALDAVTWAAGPEGKAAGLAVINLSLAGYADPAAPDYAATRDYVCGVFQAASAAGLVVVAAAGNYATNLRGYLPAACPSVIAVTSMDPASASASSFSNYLAEPATAADRARLMAAPGNGILSAISFARDASGYRELSGTSMASPHIAGVAATCVASGACSAAGGFANAAVLQAAARQRAAAVPSYGFDGDARSTRGGKYYGCLTWDKW